MTDPARQLSPARRWLARPSLRELALEEIRLAITTGQLDEGRTYSAAGLARELGMSLSPVREAMMSLVSEGTVEAIPNRGFRLRPISLEDLEEIIRIRVVLALPAVETLAGTVSGGAVSGGAVSGGAVSGGAVSGGAVSSGAGSDDETGAELAELRRLADGAVAAIEADDLPAFFRLDREFHRLLITYGLGERAAEISLRLRDQSRITGLGPAFVADLRTARELVEIVELIGAGRVADAQRAVTENLYCYRRMLGGDHPDGAAGVG